MIVRVVWCSSRSAKTSSVYQGEGGVLELELLRGGQTLGVEGPPPLRITESGGPDVETSGHQADSVKVPRGRGTMRVALAVPLAHGRGGLGPRRAPSDGRRLRLALARQFQAAAQGGAQV